MELPKRAGISPNRGHGDVSLAQDGDWHMVVRKGKVEIGNSRLIHIELIARVTERKREVSVDPPAVIAGLQEALLSKSLAKGATLPPTRVDLPGDGA